MLIRASGIRPDILIHRLFFIVIAMLSLCFARSVVGQDDGELGGYSVADLAWSPDGTQIAVGQGLGRCSGVLDDPRYAIEILDAESGEIRQILSGPFCQTQVVSWSPDGTLLATGSSDRGLWLWDLASGEVLSKYQPTAFLGADEIIWNPDGQWLVLHIGYRIEIYDLSPKTGVTLDPERIRGRMTAVSLSKEGDLLGMASESGYVYVINPMTDETVSTFQVILQDSIVLNMDWNADNSKFAVGDSKGNIYVMDGNTGETTHTLIGHSSSVELLDWGENGLLVSGGYDGKIQIWQAEALALEPLLTIDNGLPVFAASWSPDGNYLAYGGLAESGQAAEIKVVSAPTPIP